MVSGIAEKRRFKDAYGADAVISVYRDGTARLCMSGAGWRAKGRVERVYRSYRGARCAMGRMGDCWREVPMERM